MDKKRAVAPSMTQPREPKVAKRETADDRGASAATSAGHPAYCHSESCRGLKLSEMLHKHQQCVEEIDKLNEIIHLSNDEKLKEILRLREELKSMKSLMYDSVKEKESTLIEGKTLKEQLLKTSQIAKDMAQKLEKLEKLKQKTTTSAVEKEKKQTEEEIQVLNKKLHTVMGGNMHWQVYNTQRDHYVNTLMQQLDHLKLEVSESHEKHAGSCDEEMLEDAERTIASVKAKIDEIHREKEVLKDELMHFKELCDVKDRHIKELETQVERQSPPSSPTTAGLLRTKIQICTEDFEAERKDRERAQARIRDLEEEIELLKRQLSMFQQTAMSQMKSRREAALARYRREYEAQHPEYREQNRCLEGNTVVDRNDLEGGFDEID
ncbi:TNFAIP3-interacting protein 1-like [Lingula anatina]|uniref:TNFAIP3-interacting protein 1-like n=1 Tax=Lingula anatina TaxID=7574 RepID=A0A1S3IN39_LINAN|nr:TNFAIP3-interacting protein 1-like [Lingula anatina]|eukprot:XP_013399655.1 TNFAIP3-interacting protein 1-like [Lingula anatina]